MNLRTPIILSLLAVLGCDQKTETASSNTASPAPPPAAAPAASTAQPQSPPPAGPESMVPRVSVAELNQKVQSGAVVVIDVRAADQYTSAHIPSAVHIPLAFIDQEAPYLSRAKPIVTYCT